MDIRILGPVEILDADAPVTVRGRHHPKALALLLTEPCRVVTLHRLAEGLWDDEPPDTARQQVQNIIGAIRRQLGQSGSRLQMVGEGYRFEVATEELDLLRCRAAASEAKRLRMEGQTSAALTALRDGLAEWRGPALAGLSGRLVQAAARTLDEYHLSLVEDRVEIELELGLHRDLVGELGQLTADHPLRQRFTAHLMLALHRCGRTPEALQAFVAVKNRLADDLGIDPGQPLRDLHTAILREDPALAPPTPPVPLTITASTEPSLTVPAMLPADIAAFTGQSEHLRTLDSLLENDTAASRLAALTGTGGIGKTTLAIHWAHRVADRFPDGQLYVNLRGFDPNGTAMAPDEAVRLFLSALGVPPGRIPADADAQIGLYRSLVANRRILVVLDNAVDTAQVRPLLPGGPESFAIVTSRDRLSGLVAAQGAHPIGLRLLDADEASELLERRIGKQRMADEPEAVLQVIDSCMGLPLALAITAAQAATHPHFRLDAIATQLHDAHSRLDALSGDDPVTDVRAVFSWSYRALNEEAARLFRLLALHPGPDISAPAAASLTGIPLLHNKTALEELCRAHMVAEHEPGRYATHDLLRAYALELACSTDDEDERLSAIRRMLDHYLHTAFPGTLLLNPNQDPIDLLDIGSEVTPELFADSEQAFNWFAAEFRVLVRMIRLQCSAEFDAHVWQLGVALAEYMSRQGDRHEAISILSTSLSATQRLGSITGQIHFHRCLSLALCHLREYDQARCHLERALALCRHGVDHLPLARIHLDISRLHAREQQFEAALYRGRQALDLFQEIGHESGHALARGIIGWYLAQLGEFDDARLHCEQALSLHEKSGSQSRQADVWDSIGYIHLHLQQPTRAVECYQKAIRLFRGIGHQLGQAESLSHLGNAYAVVGDIDAARRSWHRALKIFDEIGSSLADGVREKLDGPNHHSVASAGPHRREGS